MRHGNFARYSFRGAAHQRSDAAGMMRLSQGRAVHETEPRQVAQEIDLALSISGQLGKQPRQNRCGQGFAYPRRAAHQQVVTPCGGQLEDFVSQRLPFQFS